MKSEVVTVKVQRSEYLLFMKPVSTYVVISDYGRQFSRV